MNENWRPVPGFEGLYEVSDLGRVRSLTRSVQCKNGYRSVRERILRQGTKPGGYRHVGLWRDNVQTAFGVHQLVAAAFLGPADGRDVAHNDGDPNNNRLDNLRYATRTQNMADQLLHGTRARGERQGSAKLTEQNVAEIRAALASGESQRSIAQRFGVAQPAIAGINTGTTWAWFEAIA